MEQGWATIKEVADLLGVSRDTIRRMIRRGELEGRRFGKRLIRIDLASLGDAGKKLAVS